jgi:DNA-directed RNA polymerase subunit RPC12/RpoP
LATLYKCPKCGTRGVSELTMTYEDGHEERIMECDSCSFAVRVEDWEEHEDEQDAEA